MTVKFKAEPIKAGDLKPGDMFSTYGPSYWDSVDGKRSVGERVYLRTNTPASEASDDPNIMVYQITVLQACITCKKWLADWPHNQCADCQAEYSFDPEAPNHHVEPRA